MVTYDVAHLSIGFLQSFSLLPRQVLILNSDNNLIELSFQSLQFCAEHVDLRLCIPLLPRERLERRTSHSRLRCIPGQKFFLAQSQDSVLSAYLLEGRDRRIQVTLFVSRRELRSDAGLFLGNHGE